MNDNTASIDFYEGRHRPDLGHPLMLSIEAHGNDLDGIARRYGYHYTPRHSAAHRQERAA